MVFVDVKHHVDLFLFLNGLLLEKRPIDSLRLLLDNRRFLFVLCVRVCVCVFVCLFVFRSCLTVRIIFKLEYFYRDTFTRILLQSTQILLDGSI